MTELYSLVENMKMCLEKAQENYLNVKNFDFNKPFSQIHNKIKLILRRVS